MFTGLIAGLGSVGAATASQEGARLSISTPLAAELSAGDSIAVDGVCLTASAVCAGEFEAQAMHVTLVRTTLGRLHAGSSVNLELPLRAGDRFGGHVVQGHVDGLGEVTAVAADGFARQLRIAAPAEILRYVVDHGSIAVNGVSLTVAAVAQSTFAVSLIPETLERTNLGRVQPGAVVNLEVDVMAKYVEKAVRMMAAVPGVAP